MKKHAQFHGSDLEEIEKIYHIPKEEIVCFGANVNPLGLSAQVKKQLAGSKKQLPANKKRFAASKDNLPQDQKRLHIHGVM